MWCACGVCEGECKTRVSVSVCCVCNVRACVHSERRVWEGVWEGCGRGVGGSVGGSVGGVWEGVGGVGGSVGGSVGGGIRLP